MSLSWTRGNGNGVIVLIRQGGAVDSAPVDGIYSGYSASSAFGGGTTIGYDNYVVYKGTDNNVTVTGLAARTTYHVAIYEFAGTVDTSGVDQGTNYKPSPATGSQTTNTPLPTPTIGVGNVFEFMVDMQEWQGQGYSMLERSNYFVPAGSNRLLMVVLHYEAMNPADSIFIDARYGNQPLHEVQRIDSLSSRVYVGYLNESEIAFAETQNQTLNVFVGGYVWGAVLTAGSFTNVNQGVPINDSKQSASDDPQSAFPFAGRPDLGEMLTVMNGGRALVFGTYSNTSLDNFTTVELPPFFMGQYELLPAMFSGGGAGFTSGSGYYEITSNGNTNGPIMLNSPQRYGVVAISLQP